MDARKEKTRRESTPVKVWVTPEEKAAIAAKADAHSLSAATLLRAQEVTVFCVWQLSIVPRS